MPVDDATYDGVVSSGTFTLGHVGPEAIGELLRVTKTGGHIVISVTNIIGMRFILNALWSDGGSLRHL